MLDNALRDEIPGSSGWLGTVGDLRAELSDDDFDPELYLIAEHTSTGSYDGLVRVWNRRPVPRLGCVAVRADWRRSRLTTALLTAVARVLAGRGVREVTAETDEENRASMLLARRVGAVPGPVDVEWSG
jgi:GNAT superfamily N-acetyltransferase